MKLKYEHLLAVIVTGMIIGLAFSMKSGRALLAAGIFVAGFLLTYLLTWCYSSKVRVEDERTVLIGAKSARNAYAAMSFLLFLEYLREYSRGNRGTAEMLLIPLALGAAVLVISHYWYERVM
ncbi:DUF2178 domain-containing protein [Thermococcus sp.]